MRIWQFIVGTAQRGPTFNVDTECFNGNFSELNFFRAFCQLGLCPTFITGVIVSFNFIVILV
jgi:hypothetical protein